MSSLLHILNISRQDMMSRLQDLDVVSNNLTNYSTSGFKSSRLNFQEMLQQATMGGVRIASTQPITTQGALQTTQNPLDVAIDGEGYFAMRLPDGRTAYTRDGAFSLDANRQLVSSSGYPLVWDGQIPADAEKIAIEANGSVRVLRGDAWTQVGTISLNHFANPSGLASFGSNLWLESPNSGVAQTGQPGSPNLGVLRSAALEQSNVNFADEMTRMVNLQRIFQITTQTFQQTDTMIAQAINMRKA